MTLHRTETQTSHIAVQGQREPATSAPEPVLQPGGHADTGVDFGR